MLSNHFFSAESSHEKHPLVSSFSLPTSLFIPKHWQERYRKEKILPFSEIIKSRNDTMRKFPECCEEIRSTNIVNPKQVRMIEYAKPRLTGGWAKLFSDFGHLSLRICFPGLARGRAIFRF